MQNERVRVGGAQGLETNRGTDRARRIWRATGEQSSSGGLSALAI